MLNNEQVSPKVLNPNSDWFCMNHSAHINTVRHLYNIRFINMHRAAATYRGVNSVCAVNNLNSSLVYVGLQIRLVYK